MNSKLDHFRKAIIVFLILLIGFFVSSVFRGGEKAASKPSTKSLRNVLVETVEYKDYTFKISGTGQLKSLQQLRIVAEVGGDIINTTPPFEEGQSFKKGDPILQLDDREASLALLAQKSQFLTQLSNLLSDISLDYPHRYLVWKAFLDRFDIHKPLADLPEITDKNERMYLAGRGFFANYYALKQAEVQREKYNIVAPFSGVVVDAPVDAGDVVSVGQYLGRFIAGGEYDVALNVRVSDSLYIKVGQPVTLTSNSLPGTWKGWVFGVNEALDPDSQLLSVTVRVSDESLKEGLYMKADIQSIEIEDVFEIPRGLLVNDESRVFIVEAGLLKMKDVTVLYKTPTHAYINGLENGALLLKQTVSGAFDGMSVEVVK